MRWPIPSGPRVEPRPEAAVENTAPSGRTPRRTILAVALSGLAALGWIGAAALRDTPAEPVPVPPEARVVGEASAAGTRTEPGRVREQPRADARGAPRAPARERPAPIAPAVEASTPAVAPPPVPSPGTSSEAASVAAPKITAVPATSAARAEKVVTPARPSGPAGEFEPGPWITP